MDYMSHLYGRSKKKIRELSCGTIYECGQVDDEKYIVTEYELFQGVKVFYNDIHSAVIRNNMTLEPCETPRYEINHCREGRFECVLKDGTITYMEAGDFAINLMSNRSRESLFPISHYHGITFCITPAEFDSDVKLLEKMYGMRYQQILESLCQDNKLFIKRATPEIQHIFHEMYRVPNNIILPYLKVKFQELLLYLSTVDKNSTYSERKYFTKSNVDIVKNINHFIKQNFANTQTYDSLSDKFHIKTTTMKNCYKSVYGETINDTLRKTRLAAAAKLLASTEFSITDIALQIGYADHSKFSKAFKQMYNLTPSEYKKMSNRTQLV